MFQKSGCHLGDAWFAVDGEVAHLFYLFCPLEVKRHTRWSIGHASSRDLRTWTDHGALFHSDPEDPAWSCLSTGSVARVGDRWVMAHLANHNQPDARVVFAESADLDHWTRLDVPGVGIPDEVYTRRGSKAFHNPRWRDPFLLEEDGWLYMLMTAAVEEASPDEDGVVGVLRTRDLRTWEPRPPLKTPRIGMDLECPKLVRIDGRYHLWVSLFDVLQSPAFAARQPEGVNPNTTYTLTADRLEGPYELTGSGRVLQKDVPGCPYACSPVCFQGQWFLLGTCWSDRLGDRISDPVALSL
jgi:beta-fructofuranosidase